MNTFSFTTIGARMKNYFSSLFLILVFGVGVTHRVVAVPPEEIHELVATIKALIETRPNDFAEKKILIPVLDESKINNDLIKELLLLIQKDSPAEVLGFINDFFDAWAGAWANYKHDDGWMAYTKEYHTDCYKICRNNFLFVLNRIIEDFDTSNIILTSFYGIDNFNVDGERLKDIFNLIGVISCGNGQFSEDADSKEMNKLIPRGNLVEKYPKAAQFIDTIADATLRKKMVDKIQFAKEVKEVYEDCVNQDAIKRINDEGVTNALQQEIRLEKFSSAAKVLGGASLGFATMYGAQKLLSRQSSQSWVKKIQAFSTEHPWIVPSATAGVVILAGGTWYVTRPK